MVEISGAHGFKHLAVKKLNAYQGVDCANTSEHDGMAYNGKMIAVPWSAAASIAVFNADKPQSFNATIPLLKGHSGTIWDVQWSPFEERLLASCADDGQVKLWVFDDCEGLTGGSHRVDADMDLEAHPRKCLSVQWHKSCENLLATHAIDKTVKIWDIHEDRADDAMMTFSDLSDYCT